jgi:hypothetical protein
VLCALLTVVVAALSAQTILSGEAPRTSGGAAGRVESLLWDVSGGSARRRRRSALDAGHGPLSLTGRSAHGRGKRLGRREGNQKGLKRAALNRGRCVGLRQVLKATAIDLGPPGVDADFGFGRADALAAVQAAPPAYGGMALAAAILPGSRAVQVGRTATAFAAIAAAGSGTATNCGIAVATSLPGAFVYQTTDPATNALTGQPNTPATIQGGSF